MRLLPLLIFAACSRSPAPTADVAPIVSASSSASASVASEPATPPDPAGKIVSASAGSWAAAFPVSKKLVTLDVPSAPRVDIEWRVAKKRKVTSHTPGVDYPIDFASRTDLVFRAAGVEKIVALGDLNGFVNPMHQSYCFAIGYELAHAPDMGKAPEPSVASRFALGVTQGESKLMLVRDGDVMHVLHQESSDGKCDDKKQGPLDVCKGREWERIADVRGLRGAALYEIVTYDGKPLDCAEDMYGSHLTPSSRAR
jgi:hypothetical protein